MRRRRTRQGRGHRREASEGRVRREAAVRAQAEKDRSSSAGTFAGRCLAVGRRVVRVQIVTRRPDRRASRAVGEGERPRTLLVPVCGIDGGRATLSEDAADFSTMAYRFS